MGRSSGKKSAGARKAFIGKKKLEPSKKTDITSLLRTPLVHVFLIAALGFLVYSNTFRSSFHWDDTPQIVHNPVIKNLENFTSNTKGYDFNPRRFIGSLTFALNYHVGGGNATGYHIVNLVIHLINALLVYFLILLTFKTLSMRQPAPVTGPPVLIALFSALLFVSHPLQTQAVTYIVQRVTSLATLFYLLSLFMYIKGRLITEEARGERQEALGKEERQGTRLWPLAFYFLSLLFAVLAMKTKEIAFTLPIMIVFYEFTFFTSPPKKKFLLLLPVILTLLIIPLSVLHSGKPLGEILSDVTQQTRVQTGMSRWDYLMTEMSVITTYIRLVFFPINQNLDYDYPLYHSLITPHVFLSFVFLLAIFGLGVYLLFASNSRRRKPLTPAPHYRLIGFGILWLFITLSVESSVIPIVDVIFEHRFYLPSVGFFIGITAGVFVAADRLKKEKVLITFFVLLLLAFSGITYARNAVWKNETSLWEDVVRKSPDKARPHNNLGYFYMRDGRLDEAYKELLTALRLNPDYVEAHTSLGKVYRMQGRKAEALRELQTALKLSPNYTEARIDFGNLYFAEGRMDEALGEYQAVLKLNPDHVEAHTNLGGVFLMQGRMDDALRELQTALKLGPDYFEAHNNLGYLYYKQGRLDQAVKEYQIALKINPEAAQTLKNLMTVYRKQGRLGE